MNDAADATAAGSAMPAADAPFEALLRRLRSDRDAGLAYEALRQRLILFYRLHTPVEADELADITLDRLARKIHEGTDITSVPLYALGIARMVLHETRARSARRRVAEADPTLFSCADDAGDAEAIAANEAVMKALSTCLDAAGAQARALILAYYGADGAARISIRQRLATEQQISLNALRNRALRLREALERCVRRSLGDPERP
jgi:DNA-directed RNA polymerase specialized sigma24 family protein